MDITVYGTPVTRSLRAVWALEEAGLEYRYERIDLRAGQGRQAPFIEINAGGKVPTLVVSDGDDSQTITESAAIVIWAADVSSSSGLGPTVTDPLRSQFLRWCVFAVAELEQPLWTMSKHTFAIPEKYRIPDVVETARWEWRVAVKVLEQGLGSGEWILGDQFSGADILLSHTLKWGTARAGELESDVLRQYMDRAFARDACRRAIEREKSAA